MRTPLVRFRPPRLSRSGLIESAEPRWLSFTLSGECEDGVEAIQKCEEALPGDTTSGRPGRSALGRIRKEEGRGATPPSWRERKGSRVNTRDAVGEGRPRRGWRRDEARGKGSVGCSFSWLTTVMAVACVHPAIPLTGLWPM